MILDDILKQAEKFFRSNNDDPIDRLYSVYSLIIFSIFVAFIGSKQYFGEPLQCSIGPSINSVSSNYIHSLCWINSTYYVKDEGNTILDFKYGKRIIYYQFIIIIILILMCLFRIPSILWKLVIYLNGFDISHVSKTIMKKMYLDEYSKNSNWIDNQHVIESVNDHLRISFLKQKSILPKKLGSTKKIHNENTDQNQEQIFNADYRKKFPNLKTKSSFPLLGPYLLIKMLCLIIIPAIFAGLSYLFSFNYFTYGVVFLMKWFNNQYDYINEFFPKRVLCTTQSHTFHKQNDHTFICVLSINLLIELFFILFWFWSLSLVVLTVFNIQYWLLLFNRSYRRNFVMNILQLSPKKDINKSYTAAFYFGDEATRDLADSFLLEKTGLTLMENFELFFMHVCSTDVIFVIKIIAINSNNLALRDLLNNLWDHYLDIDELKLKDLKQRPVTQIKRPIFPKRINEEDEFEEISEA